MGVWDVIFKPIPLPREFYRSNAELIADLETASEYLEYMEYAIDGADSVGVYRQKLDEIVKALALPNNAYKNFISGSKIVKGVKYLRQIGDISNHPEGAAWAFGKIFSGLGELAQYLPFPFRAYLSTFKDAERFFLTLRAQMHPGVHMKQLDDPVFDGTSIDNLPR